MSVQTTPVQSNMTTKEMLRTFSPIILFSIVLPIIDIVTDIRLIIRLFSSFNSCICHEDIEKLNVSHTEWENCLFSQDLSTFCQLYPHVCKLEKHSKFATILLGEFIVHMFNSNQLWHFEISVSWLLNYIASFITWYRMEKNKTWTFFLPLLNVYPIFG